MTLSQYDELLDRQQGCCAICGTDIPGGRGRFHVDHDHDTGEIRGLLCWQCNGGLGKFKDSPALLDRAASYLEATRFHTLGE